MTERNPVLQVREISKTYPGESPVYALKKTSLSFMPGEFTAVIGRSGSGKSTLLRILGTLDRSDTGELIIEGHSVDSLREAQIARFRRRRIGFVHQDYNLFPEYTAWENVILPIRLDSAAEDRKKLRGSSRPWASPTAGTAFPMSCPAASSSGFPWPGLW